MENLKNHFLSPTEKELAVLGERYLMDYIKTGFSNKGYCILTDSRLYFSGKIYLSENNYSLSTNDNISLSLDAVYSVSRVKKPIFLYKIIMILSFIISVTLLPSLFFGFYSILRGWNKNYLSVLIYLAIIVTLPVLSSLLYTMKKRSLILVEYNEGAIGLPSVYYLPKEIQDFIEKLKLAKDEFIFKKNKKSSFNNLSQRDYNSVAEELEKYKNLFENGTINENEYQTLKNRLIQLPGRF